MNRARLGLAVAAAAALILVSARADRAAPAPELSVSAATVLTLALQASRLVDYEGTKVVTLQRHGRTETVTAVEAHKRPDMVRLEYLSPPDVAGRLIVDNGRSSWHYEPRQNMAFQGPTMEAGLFSGGLAQLRRNYRATALGTDEVVGRPAYVLLLEPNTPGESRELWVDQATGTVLRTESRDPSGGRALTTYFSRISFSLNLPAAYFHFETPAGARVVPMFTLSGESASSDALTQRAGLTVVVPPVLPDEYVFTGGAVSRFGGVTSAYLRYSDGENLFSLFEAPAGSIAPGSGQPVQIGGATARLVDLGYLRVLTWDQAGLHLTAVGTVSSDTLVAIAARLVGANEDALVASVARTVAVDPSTVTALRRQGMTFPEITRAVMLSRAAGTDVRTAVRYLAGGVTGTQMAAQLGMTPAAWKQRVADALDRAATLGPHLTRSNP